MVGDFVDGAHAVHGFGVVGAAEEEDFAREFLADLFCKVGASVAGVEGSYVGVGLLEACMFTGREGEVAYDVE